MAKKIIKTFRKKPIPVNIRIPKLKVPEEIKLSVQSDVRRLLKQKRKW